ncbi:hypothetical protein ACQ4LE_000244 [Meloidogyne hapla]
MDDSFNLIRFGAEVVNSPENVIKWCKFYGMLPSERKCSNCKRPMIIRTDQGTAGIFRCQRCNGPTYAVTANTWFSDMNNKQMLAKGLLLTYAFSMGFSYQQAIRETTFISTGEITANQTVADCFLKAISAENLRGYLRARFARGDRSEAAAVVPLDISSFLRSGTKSFSSEASPKFREVCTIALDTMYADSGPIGGAGRVIECDEMKMGRRKYERGRVIEGSWITDSTIFTDAWKGYNNLSENGFEHWCVNHTYQFVTEEGVTTNKIESQWRPLRNRLSRGGIQKDKLADHLCEFLWRRDVKRRDVDVFNDLVDKIRDQFPGH